MTEIGEQVARYWMEQAVYYGQLTQAEAEKIHKEEYKELAKQIK